MIEDDDYIKHATEYTKALNESLKNTLDVSCEKVDGWNDLSEIQKAFVKALVINNTRI
jgi:hypothetical protein